MAEDNDDGVYDGDNALCRLIGAVSDEVADELRNKFDEHIYADEHLSEATVKLVRDDLGRGFGGGDAERRDLGPCRKTRR